MGKMLRQWYGIEVIHIKMLADGTLVKTSRWLIYSESPLPESWGKWIIPFVGDEGVELKEAAIYDPIDFKLIKDSFSYYG